MLLLKLNINTINISVNFVPVCMQNEKNEEKIKLTHLHICCYTIRYISILRGAAKFGSCDLREPRYPYKATLLWNQATDIGDSSGNEQNDNVVEEINNYDSVHRFFLSSHESFRNRNYAIETLYCWKWKKIIYKLHS